MSDPLVTVLMPVYNAMPYLPSAVNSILNQTEQRFNLIIVDDGSTDGSPAYLKKIKSSNVRIFRKNNEGIIKTLNYGLSLIETPYIAIMDADDISHPERLAFQLDFLEKNKDYCLVGTSIQYIGHNDNGRTIKIKMPSDYASIYNGLQKKRFVLVHSTITAKMQFIKKINGYRENSFPNPDYDLFIRLITYGKAANISNIFCKVRFHQGSHTSKFLPQIIEKLYQKSNYENAFENSKIKSQFLCRFNELKLYLITKSVELYRQGILEFVDNKIFKGIFLIIFSGIINPVRGINFFFKKLSWHFF